MNISQEQKLDELQHYLQFHCIDYVLQVRSINISHNITKELFIYSKEDISHFLKKHFDLEHSMGLHISNYRFSWRLI
ncbi:MAG: hypothetical protein KAQ94_06095 [Arcobacteraceae bacterium]|nr:hypothetical protein [Arcobacteraceae bacterium]